MTADPGREPSRGDIGDATVELLAQTKVLGFEMLKSEAGGVSLGLAEVGGEGGGQVVLDEAEEGFGAVQQRIYVGPRAVPARSGSGRGRGGIAATSMKLAARSACRPRG